MQRVLLLEDHPRLGLLIQRALRQTGVECDVFETMHQGWTALQTQPYCAALVDRGLPDGDGLALVRRWRETGQHLPCIMITARDALHDRVEGLNGGADDYLSKPFSMEELVARVRALLRRPPLQTTETPQYADMQLQPEGGTMSCGEHCELLARAEMQIMLSLCHAAGKPVRRAALESAAWGLQEAVTPNALDVALHRLRRKLAQLGSGVQIVNIRGIGYALAT